MRWHYLIVSSFIIIIIALRDSQASTAIECAYRTYGYTVLNNIYECNTNNDPNISTQDSALISSIKGVHEFSRANDDVIGFRAQTKTIQFFPVGLEEHFENLKLIHLESCPVSQLRQSDLKEYTNLEYLCVFGSQISIIEAGTFDYNTELQLLSLANNQLFHIDENAFKNLKKVTHFYLHSVPCINMYTNSRGGVEIMFSQFISKCKDLNFLSLHQKFKNLEYQLKNAEFLENLEVFEREFKASVYSEIPSFKTRLNELKSFKIDEFEAQFDGDLEQQKTCSPEKLTKSDEFKSLLNDHDLKLSQINIRIGELMALHETSKQLQDNTFNNLIDMKITVNEIDLSIYQLRLAQNVIGIAVDKIVKNEGVSSDFELKTNEKLEEIKQDLAATRHKLALNFDEKIRGIEKRLMKKFEDILEDKLVKILDEKLGSIIDAKIGAK